MVMQKRDISHRSRSANHERVGSSNDALGKFVLLQEKSKVRELNFEKNIRIKNVT